MTYTLKVDWRGYRIQAVLEVLRGAAKKHAVARVYNKLNLYLDTEDLEGYQTIKLDEPDAGLDEIEGVLGTWANETALVLLRRARDNESGLDYDAIVMRQAQVFAALQEIREYRRVTAEVVREIRKNR